MFANYTHIIHSVSKIETLYMFALFHLILLQLLLLKSISWILAFFPTRRVTDYSYAQIDVFSDVPAI